MYPIELDIKDATESNISTAYMDLLLSIRSDGQLHVNFPFTTNMMISMSILQTIRSWAGIFYLRPSTRIAFLFYVSNDMSVLAPLINVLFRDTRGFSLNFLNGNMSWNSWSCHCGSSMFDTEILLNNLNSPLFRNIPDILEYSLYTLTPSIDQTFITPTHDLVTELTFYLIQRTFHGSFISLQQEGGEIYPGAWSLLAFGT